LANRRLKTQPQRVRFRLSTCNRPPDPGALPWRPYRRVEKPVDHKGSAASVTVVLPEEIDITNAESMREQLLSAFSPGVAVVIADMTSTAFCDTSCFRNLMIAHADALASGAQLRLVIHPGTVWRALMVLGVDRLLSIYPTVDSAQTGESAA
jgi:anti-anti-sigma factor